MKIFEGNAGYFEYHVNDSIQSYQLILHICKDSIWSERTLLCANIEPDEENDFHVRRDGLIALLMDEYQMKVHQPDEEGHYTVTVKIADLIDLQDRSDTLIHDFLQEEVVLQPEQEQIIGRYLLLEDSVATSDLLSDISLFQQDIVRDGIVIGICFNHQQTDASSCDISASKNN